MRTTTYGDEWCVVSHAPGSSLHVITLSPPGPAVYEDVRLTEADLEAMLTELRRHK